LKFIRLHAAKRSSAKTVLFILKNALNDAVNLNANLIKKQTIASRRTNMFANIVEKK